jgi:hypothetical protein
MAYILFRKSSGEIVSISADPHAPFSQSDHFGLANVDVMPLEAGMLFDQAAQTARVPTDAEREAFPTAALSDRRKQAMQDAQKRFDSSDAVCRFGLGCLRAIWEQMDELWNSVATAGFDAQKRQNWSEFRARAQQAAGDPSLV